MRRRSPGSLATLVDQVLDPQAAERDAFSHLPDFLRRSMASRSKAKFGGTRRATTLIGPARLQERVPIYPLQRRMRWRHLKSSTVAGFCCLTLTASAISIRRRIASERDGLLFCCLAQLSILP